MGEVIHLSQYKHRRSPNVIFIGDLIEWIDYDNQKYVTPVLAIYYKPEPYATLLKVAYFHLEMKGNYIIDIQGNQIAASCVSKKVFRKI